MKFEYLGWLYTVEHIRFSPAWRGSGRLLSVEQVHNLVPLEGRTYYQGVAIGAVAALAKAYCGLFEGNYTVVDADTMATFPASATECTAYDETTRQEYVEVIAAGNSTNAASRAVFTFNGAKTVYGSFLSGSSVKGGTSSILLSAAKFATAKGMESGEILRVTGVINSTSS